MSKKCVRCLTLPSLVLLLLASGCGKSWPQNDSVEGTVKLDGVAVPNVMIKFVPSDDDAQGPSSSGYTDDKGHYQLTCENNKLGAVIAKHNVLVLQGRNASGSGEESNAGPTKAILAIPNAYTIVSKTPLKIEVTADKHTYDLDLNAAGSSAPRR
jgi:hypothetical protein